MTPDIRHRCLLAYDPGSQSLGLGTIKRELSRRLSSPSGLRIPFSREETGLEPLCLSQKPECDRGEPRKVTNARDVFIAQVGAILKGHELATQAVALDTS